MLSRLRHRILNTLGISVLSLFICISSTGCKKGILRTSGSSNGASVTVSTQGNLATAGGTVVSGVNKVKFTIGHNALSDKLDSGIKSARLTSTGVSREQ
jgi:hypothetical protein